MLRRKAARVKRAEAACQAERDELLTMIRGFYAGGLGSYRSIAEAIGVSRQTVSSMIAEAPPKRRRRRRAS